MGNNKERKVFLEDLVRYDSGRLKGKINWENNIGKKVRFVYDDNQGEVEIVGCENGYVKFIHENKRFEMFSGNFTKCHFGKLFSKLLKDTNPELQEEWDKEENDKLGIKFEEATTGGKKTVSWVCKKDSRHKWKVTISHRVNGNGCPYCSNKKVLKGYNDIATTLPLLVKYFADKEDAYNYTAKSGKKVLMKCPNCGETKTMTISNLSIRGFGCDKCGEGASYPEKFVRELLKELRIDFIKELNSKHKDWIVDNKRYDFYFELNNEEYIVEAHGIQHYERDFSACGGRTLEDEQENDKFKKELTLSNGIKEENYIVLDCRNSELEWIKNSIMNSRLNEIFDLSDIDWLKIEEKATKTLVKEISEFYEKNKDTMIQKDMAKEFDINENTLINYLKKGDEIGWCSYSAEAKMREAICLNFNKSFDSLTEASKEYGLKSRSKIGEACQGKRKSAGKHPQTRERLHWMYLDEFKALSIQEQEELLSKYKSKEETLHTSKE